MGNKQNAGTGFLLNVQQCLLHIRPGKMIQGGKRFIHQDESGMIEEGTGQGGALLHSPGELMRQCPLEAGEPHRTEHPPGFIRLNLCPFQRKLDVIQNREPGQETRLLENEGGPLIPGQDDLPAVRLL